MKTALLCSLLLLAAGCRSPLSTGMSTREAAPRLAHDVFFTLREDTPEARAALAAACQTLAHLEGVESLSVGPLAEELVRPVNDQAFDVALHVVFVDRAAHDRYQSSPEHQALLSVWSERFETVRVFDSWVH